MGAGLSVRLSVSTHHRAQSLFPRLKPSQLKSSKPRVVGATPPPAEERDRCSREGGKGGGPCKACWWPMPHPGHAPAAHTTGHSPGPADSQDKTRREQGRGGGARQVEAAPSVSPDGFQLAALCPHPCTGGRGLQIHRGCAAVPEPALDGCHGVPLNLWCLTPAWFLPHPWATCILIYLTVFSTESLFALILH